MTDVEGIAQTTQLSVSAASQFSRKLSQKDGITWVVWVSYSVTSTHMPSTTTVAWFATTHYAVGKGRVCFDIEFIGKGLGLGLGLSLRLRARVRVMILSHQSHDKNTIEKHRRNRVTPG